jgi:hypothetical protein
MDADADALAFEVGGQRIEALPSTAFGEAHGSVRCGKAESRCLLLKAREQITALVREGGVQPPASSRLPRVMHLFDWDAALRLVPPAWYRIIFQTGEKGGLRAIPTQELWLDGYPQDTGETVDGHC